MIVLLGGGLERLENGGVVTVVKTDLEVTTTELVLSSQGFESGVTIVEGDPGLSLFSVELARTVTQLGEQIFDLFVSGGNWNTRYIQLDLDEFGRIAELHQAPLFGHSEIV